MGVFQPQIQQSILIYIFTNCHHRIYRGITRPPDFRHRMASKQAKFVQLLIEVKLKQLLNALCEPIQPILLGNTCHMSHSIKNNHSKISADSLPCLLDKNSQCSSRAVRNISHPLFKRLLVYYFKVARVHFVGMLGGWRNHRPSQIPQIFKGKNNTPPQRFCRRSHL